MRASDRRKPRFLCAVIGLFLFCQQNGIAGEPSKESQACSLGQQASELGTKKQYDRAIDLLRQAIILNPKDPWFPGTIGYFFLEQKKYAEALPYLRSAHNLAPTDFAYMNNICYALEQQNRPDELIASCEYFASTHSNEKQAATLWNKLAHAHAQLRQFDEAYAAYDKSFDLQATDPNDWWRACNDFKDPAAAQYLYPLYREYARRFPNHEGVRAVAPGVKATVQLARSSKSASIKDPFDTFISYKDPKKCNVSTGFYGMAKEGLRAIPHGIWQPLLDNGYKVILTPYVTDIKTDGCDKRPRGYRKGATYYNVPGLYIPEKKFMVIAEYSLGYDGKPVRSADVVDIVCHEFGHAVDAYLGAQRNPAVPFACFSHDKPFFDAYTTDAANLTPSERKELEYYLQPDNKAGQEELFAELFPIIFDEAAQVPGSDDELLAKRFPTTLALIAKTLHVVPSSSKRQQSSSSRSGGKQKHSKACSP